MSDMRTTKQKGDVLVDGRAGKFHTWETVSHIFALVEFEDGHIERCEPIDIIFVPSKITTCESKQEQLRSSCDTAMIECPFCDSPNANATLVHDRAGGEYFVYCLQCKIETLEAHGTKAKSLKAFAERKVCSIN